MQRVREIESRSIVEDEIDLVELIRIIIKGKKIIFLSISLFFLFGLTTGLFLKSRNYESRVLINFNFDGIIKGENPDGSPFNINLITSTPVLTKVIEKESSLKEKNIGIETLKKAISIEPVKPNYIIKKIEESYKNGEVYTYYPTIFMLSFKLTKDLKYDRKILDRIIHEYKSYFEYRYNRLEIVGNANSDYEKYDYIELLEIIDNNLLRTKNFLQEEKNNKFRSSILLLTYSDLLSEIELLEDIEVKSLKSIVENKNLSKNKWRVIEKYKNVLKDLEFKRSKYIAEEKIVKEMLDNYKPENNYVVIPNIDGSIVENNRESYYSKLVEKAVEAGVNAVYLAEDIDYYKNRIIELENEKNRDNLYFDEVNKLIELIKLKYNKTIEDINVLNKEYNQVYFSNMIKKISPIESFNESKLELFVLVSLFLGMIFGILVIFIIEFKNKHL